MPSGESAGCLLLRLAARLFDCAPPPPPPTVVIVGFGRTLRPDQPNPAEGMAIVAMANIGERVPLIAIGKTADGTVTTYDGPPVWDYQTPGVFETEADPATGLQYARALAAGETIVELDIDADRTAGVRLVHAVGLLICNDPATEAVTAEIQFGPAEPGA